MDILTSGSLLGKIYDVQRIVHFIKKVTSKFSLLRGLFNTVMGRIVVVDVNGCSEHYNTPSAHIEPCAFVDFYYTPNVGVQLPRSLTLASAS